MSTQRLVDAHTVSLGLLETQLQSREEARRTRDSDRDEAEFA